MHKAGFISIIGRPNAGKSTMLNNLLEQKVAIMSDKPNTTRNNIAGILNTPDVQYIFLDTPGIHKPQQHLGRVLNQNAYHAMEQSDVVAWIVDGTQQIGRGDEFILNRLSESKKPVVLLVNKIDQMDRARLMDTLQKWNELYNFDAIIPLSALKKDNLDEVLRVMEGYLPESESLYPEDMVSDHSLEFQLCELVREKILRKTHDEIPHSVAVVLESQEEEEGILYLSFLIIVDRQSQKRIIVGHQGSKIKDIRVSAQREIRRKLERPVKVELFVRVEENWRNRENKIKEFGMDEWSE